MDIALEIDPRLFFVPVAEALIPPAGIIEHLKDHWWIVHPERGLAFWDKLHKSPQCNSSESITRRLASAYPWAEVRFFPSVFRRVKISDYCD